MTEKWSMVLRGERDSTICGEVNGAHVDAAYILWDCPVWLFLVCFNCRVRCCCLSQAPHSP